MAGLGLGTESKGVWYCRLFLPFDGKEDTHMLYCESYLDFELKLKEHLTFLGTLHLQNGNTNTAAPGRTSCTAPSGTRGRKEPFHGVYIRFSTACEDYH
jgi:hypothetical protein